MDRNETGVSVYLIKSTKNSLAFMR